MLGDLSREQPDRAPGDNRPEGEHRRVDLVPAAGVNSSALLQLPALSADRIKTERKLKLELREGDRVVWQTESQLPQRVLLTLRGRRCLLTATRVNEQVHLDLREDPGTVSPTAN